MLRRISRVVESLKIGGKSSKLKDSERERRFKQLGISKELQVKIVKNNRCYILAMGPSLAKINKDALRDEFTIGVNYILKTGYVPDIICVSDPRRLDCENILNNKAKLFTPSHCYKIHSEKLSLLDDDLIYKDFDFSYPNTYHEVDGFDPTFKNIYAGGGVIADLAIPLCVYLGVKEVYVLGLDDVSRSFPVSHVWGNESKVKPPDSNVIFHDHERVAYLAEKEGVKIYNASVGGFVTAFKRENLLEVNSNAVLTSLSQDILGKHIAFNDHVLSIRESSLGENAYQFFNEEKELFLRHKKGHVYLEKYDGTEIFEKDTSFYVEPSFVNSEWVSLRSYNIKDAYVTALNEVDGFHLRRLEKLFSPYFSSFKLFESAADAQSRVDINLMLKNLAEMRAGIGNVMIKMDGCY